MQLLCDHNHQNINHEDKEKWAEDSVIISKIAHKNKVGKKIKKK